MIGNLKTGGVRMKRQSLAFRRIIARNNQIEIGKIYFLSSFYGKEGAYVRVTAKSTKENRCGWPSTVSYEVVESVNSQYYTKHLNGNCNATNLYESRELAANPYKN